MAGEVEDGAEDMIAEAKDTEDKASQITGRSGMSLIFTPPSKDRLYTVPPNVLSARPVSASWPSLPAGRGSSATAPKYFT